MAKIYLNKSEKEILKKNGVISIERQYSLPCPNSSIIHGKGTKYIWDKIERIWVYGDVDNYIEVNKNLGRRALDYKDNTRNTWGGRHWFEFLGKDQNEYGNIGSKFINGKKNVIEFTIEDIFISELRLKTPDNTQSVRMITFIIDLKLTTNTK